VTLAGDALVDDELDLLGSVSGVVIVPWNRWRYMTWPSGATRTTSSNVLKSLRSLATCGVGVQISSTSSTRTPPASDASRGSFHSIRRWKSTVAVRSTSSILEMSTI
jgi:hypothetical protein